MSETFDVSYRLEAEPLRERVAAAAGIGLRDAFVAGAALAMEAVSTLDRLGAQATAGERLPAARAASLNQLRVTLDALETRPDLALLNAACVAEDPTALRDAAAAIPRLSRMLSAAPADSAARRELEGERTRVEGVVVAATARLYRAERQVVAQAVAGALAEIGCTSSRAVTQRNGITVIGGTDPSGVTVWVEVDTTRGHVTADVSGCGGTSCLARGDEFVAALARRGIRVRINARQHHGLATGGQLARRAAAALGMRPPVADVGEGVDVRRIDLRGR